MKTFSDLTCRSEESNKARVLSTDDILTVPLVVNETKDIVASTMSPNRNAAGDTLVALDIEVVNTEVVERKFFTSHLAHFELPI